MTYQDNLWRKSPTPLLQGSQIRQQRFTASSDVPSPSAEHEERRTVGRDPKLNRPWERPLPKLHIAGPKRLKRGR